MKKVLKCAIVLSMLFLIAACGTGEEQTETRDLELQTAGLSKLVIDNRNGKIEIAGHTDSDKIEVTAQARAKGVSLDKLKLTLEDREGTAYLDASFEGQFLAMGSGFVDLQIKVPKHLQVDIMSHRDGDMHISNMSSNVKIGNINGNIQVLNTAGPLDIDNRDGDITIREIASDVTIANINGHIIIEQVGGSAVIDVRDGSLDIDGVAKDAAITQSGNGKVSIGDVKGKVTQKKK
ncbi:hypothetical protein [Paenibacillus sp. OSY-SE]|uniref:hypothetical protein n=1 Tax=Paenibacillus sp. OSY-SE TaxID=1196323 RepID=UPI0002F3347D|nr:hypothetical protein [Paenibacillus sp. OSY-SE]